MNLTKYNESNIDKKESANVEIFNEWFYYDETSSTCLRWKKDKFVGKNFNVHRIVKDSEAGGFHYRRYLVCINFKSYAVHRIVLSLHSIEVEDGKVVDHIDGNPFNNKISNLRVVTQAVNSRNKKIPNTNTSGINGVGLHQNKYWKAQWYENGRLSCKYFSIEKYGNATALDLAINFRKCKIEELNKIGYNYSERHGMQTK